MMRSILGVTLLFSVLTAQATPGWLRNEFSGAQIDQSHPIDNGRKIIVLVHGWTNRDSAPPNYDAYQDGAAWYYLLNVMKLKLQNSDWNLASYHWEQDASTGNIWSLHTSDFFGYTPAMIAAANAHGQGSTLGSLLHSAAPNLREVHFIAHSAGSWAAREAMRFLLDANPYVVTQLTILDPFIPDAAIGFGNTTGLDKSLMSSVAGLNGATRIHRLENYYADDSPLSGWNPFSSLGPTISTQETFSWRSGIDINQRVEHGGGPGYDIYYDYHSGPIEFYADTVNATTGTIPTGLYLGNPPFVSFTEVGFYHSLVYEDGFLRPIITAQPPKTATVPAGSPLVLSLTAQRATAYTWYKDGIYQGNERILNIPNSSASNSGIYIARVSNDHGLLYSDEVSVTVTASPPTGLAAPTNLVASAVSASQINLNWSDNSSNETGFVVERATGSSAYGQIGTAAQNARTYSDASCASNTTYFYRVRAVNSSQSSGNSNVATATTLAATGATPTLTIASANPSSGVSVSSFVGSGNYQNGTTPTSRSFALGTSVGVTCPQTLSGGKYFQKWQLDGGDYSFATYVTVTMDRAHTLTAIYGTSAPPNRILTNLVVEGPSSVNESSSTQYQARATYSDGSSTYVTPSWSEDSSYATISSNGVLDAGEVSSDRAIHVIAQYSAGGTTITYSKDVTIRNTNTTANYQLTISTTSGGSVGHSPPGNSYAAGTVVSLHANHDSGYVFSHWTGDVSGTDDDTTVRMDGNRSVTANFVADTSQGSLQVNLSPFQAVVEGAQWRFDTFTSWRDSGNTQSGISPRTNRYVHFKDIPGWITPDEIKTSIVGGQTTVIGAVYREILGTVQVTISPPEAIAAGAKWRLDGGAWQVSGTALNSVSPGNHSIDFMPVSGWSTPLAQGIPVTRGNATVTEASYGPPAGVPLITSIVPNTGSIEGGIPITIEGVNFAPGATVKFGDVSATQVTVESNSRLIAILPPRLSYGTVSVAVTSAGQTATRANGFTYDIPLGMNMTLLSQLGGSVQAVAVQGSVVLYGEGNSLVSADFTNPAAPIVRGRIALPGIIRDVKISGNHAFIANAGSGLQIVDISDLTTMARVGFYDTPGNARKLALSGNFAYIADDGSGGLQIIDFTDRTAPRRVAAYTITALDIGLTVIGGRKIACIASYPNGVTVLDVTNASSIQELSTIEPNRPNDRVTVSGQTVIVTGELDGNPGNLDGKVYNIATPESPVKVGQGFTFSDSPGVINGTTFYTGNEQDGDLSIYDIGTSHPPRLSNLALPGKTLGIALSGSTLFMANGNEGLIAVDVATSSSPNVRSTVNNGFSAGAVTVENNTAYVAFGGGRWAAIAFPVVTALNVIDRRNPQRAGTTNFNNSVKGLLISGGVLFGTTQQRGIPSFNIQDPLSPSLISARAADRDTYGAARLGENLLLGGGTQSDGPSYPLLTVLDGTDPNNDTPLSTFQLSTTVGMGVVQGVVARDSTVFAFLSNAGMRVLDYANLASPTIIGAIDFPGYPSQAAISSDGRFIYAADFSNGLRIFECTNPTAPVLVNTYVRNGETYAKHVTVHEELVFYADNRGLNVLDCSDPANPLLVAAYDTPGSPEGLFVDGNYIFVADGPGGLAILELGDISQPIGTIQFPTNNSVYETSDTFITLSGTASDAQGILRVSWTNSRGGGGEATGTTNWNIANIQLFAGTNIITVTVEDINGNITHRTLTVNATWTDNTPPVVTVTNPNTDNEYRVSAPAITVSGTAADNVQIANISWSNDRGGSGVASGTNTWIAANIPLFEGPNVISFAAHDAAGNTGTRTQIITYAPDDMTLPGVVIDFPTIDPVWNTTSSKLNVSGSASDDQIIAQIRWENDRGGSGMATGANIWFVNDISLKTGLNTITATATDSSGNVSTDTLSVNYTPTLMGNISTRLSVGTGDNVLIGGFIITGSQPKKVIVRAIGPALAGAGLTGLLADPTLELHDGTGALVATNDNWQTTQIGGIINASQVSEIQSSGLAPTQTAESAIVATLSPGAYTAIVRGKSNTTGIALVESYDLSRTSDSKLANISTRGFVQTGDDVMIGGLIVQGIDPTRVIIRAIGPSLTQAGITNPLQDPTLELHDGNGGLLTFNDNWRNDQQAEIQGTGLAPSNNAESAIVAMLSPGAYTAIVRGKNNTSGIALIEAYQLGN